MYKALIVDDEQMIRMGIKEGIEWENLGVGEVYTAASAREALRIIEEKHPELMITDISMSEMTGLDLIREIRRRKLDMRILVLTGYDSFNFARQCLRMQVQNFLLKPVDEDELSDNIRQQVEYLEQARRQAELDQSQKRAEGTRQQAELERVMYRFISSEDGNIKEVEMVCGLDPHRKMQTALLFWDMDVNCGEEEQYFRMATLKNICMGLVDSRGEGITFPDAAGRLVVVMYLKEGSDDITQQMDEIKGILEDEDDARIHIVLGSVAKRLEDLYLSYNDAVYLIEAKRAEFLNLEDAGYDPIVRPGQTKDKQKIFRDVYEEFKKSMTENISNCEYVLHAFQRFRRAADAYNISDNSLKRLCFELASAVMFSYSMNTGETQEHLLEGMNRALLGSGREETLDVTSGFLNSLLGNGSSGKESNEIIARAKSFIGEHLGENLSVATLAEIFYVSPNYFSRLFKRVEGEGCNEYIVRKRIEKAKTLLETTTMKTGRVAMTVGYNDTNYFSIAFKKHTGVSPTKYREQYREKGGGRG
ncbi:MAG TPA: response regulator [Candidatus Limivivens merdigallinarum]|uniref:Stage 0 sporulation protein A homolog n=1 Tax=Candidatus Limivivens merdigallinarum TaxID=2840859 RepID=A0A9D0ZV97_9FIRM|nr:response regulator [Candidatus Limivivens merdigallinarum]